MHVRIASAVLAALLAVGCQTPTKQQSGAVLGGVAGGVIGSQFGHGSGRTAATIAGVLIGGFVGGSIGEQMDQNDRYQAQRALETSPTQQSTSWRNPDTGNSYTVTPTSTYESTQGPCREYETDAIIDGRREVVTGTACRQSDGTWQAAN